MKRFSFQKIQYGYWGQTVIGTVIILAEDSSAAIRRSREKHKQLNNGDRIRFELIESSV
jgi:hypothetical protein